jgi:transposase
VKGQVIEFHSATIPGTRWIGVDLNTTGHVAVVADLFSGKVMKLGKNAPYVHSHWLKNCTKPWKSGKFWKLKKLKSRKHTIIKGAIHTISKQIVSFAESVGSGIKFEKLFNTRIEARIEAPEILRTIVNFLLTMPHSSTSSTRWSETQERPVSLLSM